MSVVIDERPFRFVFGDDWQVVKWDDSAAYREGIEKLKWSKLQVDSSAAKVANKTDSNAVDILGCLKATMYIIEVKDFREEYAANRSRIGHDLAVEVGFKVRDTLAGLVGALRRSKDYADWQPFTAHLMQRAKGLVVVLWLEQPAPTPYLRKEHERRMHTLLQKLKRACGWLTKDAIVVDISSFSRVLKQLRVSSLPKSGNQP